MGTLYHIKVFRLTGNGETLKGFKLGSDEIWFVTHRKPRGGSARGREGWTNPGIMGPKAPMRSVPGALIQKDILKRRSCLLLYKTSSAHRELAVFTRSPDKTGWAPEKGQNYPRCIVLPTELLDGIRSEVKTHLKHLYCVVGLGKRLHLTKQGRELICNQYAGCRGPMGESHVFFFFGC